MRKLHLRHVHVHLFRDEHQDAGRRAVTELRLAMGDRDRVIRVERDPRVNLRLIRKEVRRSALAERGIRVRSRCGAGDAEGADANDECAATLQKRLA